ncbi:sensor histidine kinase [Noviherbaspirillum pedocola]|uniref:histidine kinase n=1 Tax=Noviherbaspirillum pedocola TaxID=2801341 RepID=A0A934W9P7_9BURK|nr:PAS domain-containing sensor histidine kinase [Noviherbaspirillum pedocola]MBK4738448.1 PAS domain-containing sensor histidine kinase [Noviherbaspirillum pedocola]
MMTNIVAMMNGGAGARAGGQGGTPKPDLLKLMAQASERLNQVGSETDALALLQSYAHSVAGADAAILLLRDSGLRHSATSTDAPDPYLWALADWAARRRQTAVVAELGADTLVASNIERPAGIGSVVLLALELAGEPAAIAFLWRTPHAPQPDELAALEILAHAGSAALARQRYENRLHEDETRYAVLGRASPALIWQTDAEGNLAHINWDHVNGDAQEHAGTWDRLLHPEDTAAFGTAFADARQRREPFRWRARLRDAHGAWRWLDMHALPLDAADGGYAGHVGIAIDVSEALRAGEALRQADRRKDEFLATLAHELRNPLAPISNVMYMLRHEGGRRRADRLLQIVERQVRHIVRLVDDLLEMSRITRGQIALRRAPMLLADALNAAIETARPQIESNRHRLELSLPPEALCVHGDMVRLTQAFTNLLDNAARYTEPGGEIRITARREGKTATVSIADNGMGIAAELRARIFDLFTRGQRGCGPGGLGIGLPMVKSLVELHGGVVELRSDGPGRGSEFIVRLPALERTPDETN